jgi:hypothetical protein
LKYGGGVKILKSWRKEDPFPPRVVASSALDKRAPLQILVVFGGSGSSSNTPNSDLTSRFVNALGGAAAQYQSPVRDKQGLLPKLFGDIGSVGKLFGFI